jgi:hypothetical protein
VAHPLHLTVVVKKALLTLVPVALFAVACAAEETDSETAAGANTVIVETPAQRFAKTVMGQKLSLKSDLYFENKVELPVAGPAEQLFNRIECSLLLKGSYGTQVRVAHKDKLFEIAGGTERERGFLLDLNENGKPSDLTLHCNRYRGKNAEGLGDTDFDAVRDVIRGSKTLEYPARADAPPSTNVGTVEFLPAAELNASLEGKYLRIEGNWKIEFEVGAARGNPALTTSRPSCWLALNQVDPRNRRETRIGDTFRLGKTEPLQDHFRVQLTDLSGTTDVHMECERTGAVVSDVRWIPSLLHTSGVVEFPVDPSAR